MTRQWVALHIIEHGKEEWKISKKTADHLVDRACVGRAQRGIGDIIGQECGVSEIDTRSNLSQNQGRKVHLALPIVIDLPKSIRFN